MVHCTHHSSIETKELNYIMSLIGYVTLHSKKIFIYLLIDFSWVVDPCESLDCPVLAVLGIEDLC